MTRIALSRDAPQSIRVDNGPEFISKALDRWAYENGVTLDFSRLSCCRSDGHEVRLHELASRSPWG